MNLSSKRVLMLVVLFSMIGLIMACSESIFVPVTELTISCPPDTTVPINRSSPEEIGVFPVVAGGCSESPTVIGSRDSIPPGMVGGLIRIWEVSDTCGNTVTCNQSIGLGAPQ